MTNPYNPAQCLRDEEGDKYLAALTLAKELALELWERHRCEIVQVL